MKIIPTLALWTSLATPVQAEDLGQPIFMQGYERLLVEQIAQYAGVEELYIQHNKQAALLAPVQLLQSGYQAVADTEKAMPKVDVNAIANDLLNFNQEPIDDLDALLDPREETTIAFEFQETDSQKFGLEIAVLGQSVSSGLINCLTNSEHKTAYGEWQKELDTYKSGLMQTGIYKPSRKIENFERQVQKARRKAKDEMDKYSIDCTQ